MKCKKITSKKMFLFSENKIIFVLFTSVKYYAFIWINVFFLNSDKMAQIMLPLSHRLENALRRLILN